MPRDGICVSEVEPSRDVDNWRVRPVCRDGIVSAIVRRSPEASRLKSDARWVLTRSIDNRPADSTPISLPAIVEQPLIRRLHPDVVADCPRQAIAREDQEVPAGAGVLDGRLAQGTHLALERFGRSWVGTHLDQRVAPAVESRQEVDLEAADSANVADLARAALQRIENSCLEDVSDIGPSTCIEGVYHAVVNGEHLSRVGSQTFLGVRLEGHSADEERVGEVADHLVNRVLGKPVALTLEVSMESMD